MNTKLLTTIAFTFFILLCSNKISYAQNYQWAHGFGTANANSQGSSIATDAQANVYVAGTFGDSIDFNPGAGVATLGAPTFSAGAMFIAKYDSAGVYQWAFSLQGYYSGSAPSIAVNATGLYVTGCFNATVDFDPSAATASLTANGADIFLAKYDLSGNYVWAKNMGGNNTDVANSIAIDNVGNSYITGYFKDTADFDPNVGTTFLISNGIQDAFFAKYDNLGNYQWAHSIGDTLSSGGYTIILNSITDAIYIAGYFRGTPDFDPSASASVITSIGQGDDFIAKYDTSGNYIWVGAISSSFTAGNLIGDITSYYLNGFEYLYVTGLFRNVTDFDLSTNIFNLSSTGISGDLFFAKYDNSGSLIWIKTISNSTLGGVSGISLKIGKDASLFLCGYYFGTTDFDSGANLANLTSNGSSDIFFAKYDSTGDFIWAKGIGGTFTDQPAEIALDYKNNQYLTGFFTNSIDADPDIGSVILSPTQSENIFIGKYIETPSGILNSLTQNDGNITLYPNPSDDFISFKEHFNQQKFDVKILNVLGQTIFENTASSNILNTNSLKRGIYFLQIVVHNKTYSGKFIKQ